MSDKLKQRGYAFSLVLNDNGADLFKSASYLVKRILNSKLLPIKYIACIFHDNDVDDYGNLKTKHYHMVITIDNNLTILNVINKLVDILHCNVNQIQIEKCNDISSQTRYLIHLDDTDKYQYLPFDIVTNNQMLVSRYLSKEININDSTDIDVVCDRCHYSIREIAKLIGDKQLKKWLWYITATRNEKYR